LGLKQGNVLEGDLPQRVAGQLTSLGRRDHRNRRLEHMLGMQAIATHWGELPEREQQIVTLRFYGGMTQAQLGRQLGPSQMHVSRLLARALGYLRPRLFGEPDFVSEAVLEQAPARAPLAWHPAQATRVAIRQQTAFSAGA
jgi:hypothetical protein